MKMQNFLLPAGAFIALGLQLGCGSSTGLSDMTPVVTPDVFVAGVIYNNPKYPTVGSAAYWRNGVATVLGNPNDSSSANSIAVSGNDVYVAGTEGSGPNNIAKYWKNGVAVALTDGIHQASANAIVVSGSDVYVAGTVDDGNPPSLLGGNYEVAEYWKNGAPVLLSDGTRNATADAIFISGTDVYVAGSTTETTQTAPNSTYSAMIATVWKNGTPTYLTDGLHFSNAVSVYVYGTDVYAAGFVAQTAEGLDQAATLWKNGTPETLSTIVGSAANSVFVLGTDVYGAGESSSGAAYWKNGIEVPLTGTVASQVTVVGNDVYVAGDNFPISPIIGSVVRNAASNSYTGAMYWQNGNFIPLPPAVSANANSIAVVTH